MMQHAACKTQPCALIKRIITGAMRLTGAMLLNVLLGMLSGAAHAALLTLMQPSIEPGGSFDILIETQDQAGAPPQLGWSPELEKHFQITWMDQSTQALNQGFQHRWLLTLRQRPNDTSTGMLTLPPFTLGDDRTQPLRVMVTPPEVEQPTQSADADHNAVISIRHNLSHSQAYAGQTLVYRMEILYQGYPFDPSLSPLKMEGAQGRQLGEPIEQQVSVNGQRYQEARWRDLITINQAPARILPRQFSARLSPFPGSHQSRRHQAEAPSIDIEVLPKPKEFPDTATWLPAQGLALDYDLPNTERRYQAGDTLQLTLYLDAVGQQGRLLPTFPRLETADYSITPVRHHVQDRLVSHQLVGNLQQVMLVTLKRSGQLQLPTLSVPWWDVERHRLRHAELSLPTLKVSQADTVTSETQAPTSALKPPRTALQSTATTYWGILGWGILDWGALGWGTLIMVILISILGLAWHHYRQRPQQRLARRIRHQDRWSHSAILDLLNTWRNETGQPHPAWHKQGLLRVLRHAAAGHTIPQSLLAKALLGRRQPLFKGRKGKQQRPKRQQQASSAPLPPLYPDETIAAQAPTSND